MIAPVRFCCCAQSAPVGTSIVQQATELVSTTKKSTNSKRNRTPTTDLSTTVRAYCTATVCLPERSGVSSGAEAAGADQGLGTQSENLTEYG